MKLSWRDKFQMITTVLFIVIGVTMLARSAALARDTTPRVASPPALAYIMGAAFIGYGVYRAYLIAHALRDRGSSQ
jgi:heme/copper-type cytochrome/quinol oxidase subunit 3